MFCVFSGKKKKSHPEIISSPMGMTFKKNTLSSGHCPNWGGNPLPKLILALFEKWEKLPTLACGEGTYVFFLEVSWGPNLQSSLWRLPNHKKTKQMIVFPVCKKKLKSGSMHRPLTVWLPDEKLVAKEGKEGTSTTFYQQIVTTLTFEPTLSIKKLSGNICELTTGALHYLVSTSIYIHHSS